MVLVENNHRLPLPTARGALSEFLLDLLTSDADPYMIDSVTDVVEPDIDAITDHDFQLSLFVLYELHYRGIDGVDDTWEWSPNLLDLRARLEHRFEQRINTLLGPAPSVKTLDDVIQVLSDLTAPDPRSRLTSFVARRAEKKHVQELLTHRSVYHLKEA